MLVRVYGCSSFKILFNWLFSRIHFDVSEPCQVPFLTFLLIVWATLIFLCLYLVLLVWDLGCAIHKVTVVWLACNLHILYFCADEVQINWCTYFFVQSHYLYFSVPEIPNALPFSFLILYFIETTNGILWMELQNVVTEGENGSRGT